MTSWSYRYPLRVPDLCIEYYLTILAFSINIDIILILSRTPGSYRYPLLQVPALYFKYFYSHFPVFLLRGLRFGADCCSQPYQPRMELSKRTSSLSKYGKIWVEGMPSDLGPRFSLSKLNTCFLIWSLNRTFQESLNSSLNEKSM